MGGYATQQGRGSWQLIIGLIVALVSIIGYYGHRALNPMTGETQHVSLKPDEEIALGLRAAPQMEAQYGGVSGDAVRAAHVQEVGPRIVSRSEAKDTPYRYQFHLLADAKTVNAFALPGGQVFMTEALATKLHTPGQYAGVLGHEIGHVVARHSAEHLAKAQLTQGLGGAAVIASYDPRNPNRSAETQAVAAAVMQLVNLRFSRQDESEADRLGVHLMSEAGYDPRSMIDVMKVLESVSQSRPIEFFSTHPNPEHRITQIQAAIQERFPNGVPAGLEK